jgi:glycosyltransferase involved in cell wall biosynthesis
MTSTFPRWATDDTPRFIESLCHELANSFQVVVLAPHFPGTLLHETLGEGSHTIEVCRYRYFIPAFETLAYDGGILSAIRQNPLRLLLLPFFLAAQLIAAIRLHRRYNFDALHAHWIIPQGAVAVALCRLVRRAPRVLVTAHGSDLFALRGRITGWVKNRVLRRADSVTVVSEAMQRHCEEAGTAGKVTVQPMGVDLDSRFTPGDAGQVREGLLFVGRLVDIKGTEHLVRAMGLLVRRFPDLPLTIVGDGPLRGSLQDLAASLGLSDNVRFAGAVPHADLPQYFRAARVFVMPSIQEGLGLVAVEAMGCGCAVVASDLPTVRDAVIDGETGLTATVGDSEDIAQKISRLLLDENLCSRLARRGRELCEEKFAWKIVGRRYTGIIRDMLI